MSFLLVLFTMFYAYNLTLYNMLCDYSHIPLHHPRNKKEIKSKKIDKIKIK